MGWQQGTALPYLQELVGHWADGFDWRAQERFLNGFEHFHTELDGIRLHFVRQRARGGRGLPLILAHGWSSSFIEYLPLLPWLTDPVSHGLTSSRFDVVLPFPRGVGRTPLPICSPATSSRSSRTYPQ
ncbi:hypothetical protein BH20ACT5_BH20ACT5_01890 [soil metagenome]